MTDEKVAAAPDESGSKAAKASQEASASRDKDLMYAKIFAPFQVYFEGQAASISAVNESGPFDILAHHHNFITMLLPCDLVVHSSEGDKIFRISRGLMHVRDNRVTVFLDV